MPYPVVLYFDKNDMCSRKLLKYMNKKEYQFSRLGYNTDESKIALKYHGHNEAPAPVVQIGKMFFYGDRLFDRKTMKLATILKNCLKDHAERKTPVAPPIPKISWSVRDES